MSEYKFNLTVQTYVTRILVYNAINGIKVYEMIPVVEIDEGKIFNGTITKDDLDKYAGKFMVRLLSNEGVLETSAHNVLSVPIAHESSIRDISKDKDKGIENFIVVNDIPGEAESCFVQFSPRFAKAMNIAEEIELIRKARGQLKKEWSMKNSELLARGIDPAGQNFVASLLLRPVDKYATEIIDELEKEIVIIKLYGIDIRKNLHIEQS